MDDSSASDRIGDDNSTMWAVELVSESIDARRPI